MASNRVAMIDAGRGVAIVLMIVYHFCFDLAYFGWLVADFNNHLAWLSFRALIVSSFLFLVGVSLVLARHQTVQRFWRRVGIIVACAGLVTLSSYLMFPQSFITFGVLHHIALASVLARALVNYPVLAANLGVLCLVLGNLLSHPVFNHPGLNWLGLMTHKPTTEDYVPLLPWFGVVALGIFAGHRFQSLNQFHFAGWALLSWLGRRSLLIYMIHQPLLIGVLWGVSRF